MGIVCSCCRRPSQSGQYAPLLAENEREAISVLLQFLENRSNVDFFTNGPPLRALTTLVYSDNIDLQRSAALAFSEITEKDVRPVTREILEPILLLLQSSDTEVQRAACAALGNLAVNNQNKVLIIEMGGLEPLIRQMMSPNIEVQCNAVGCITNLATHDDNKGKIAKSGALGPLTKLAKSRDIRVQRNATGALLNMTHSGENRAELVKANAVPVLVSLLQSPDPDVQYYCSTALSNIAVDESNRRKLALTEPKLVNYLVKLMDSPSARIQGQATLALRNLASDPEYQLEIVKAQGLPRLLRLLQSDEVPLVLAAVACVRNISIHPQNEAAIIDAGFLPPLVALLDKTDNEEIQCHAVSTLRNLVASADNTRLTLISPETILKCKELVLHVPVSVQSEISAFFAILALTDQLKPTLLKLGIIDVLIPLSMSTNTEVCGNSAAALANICLRVGDPQQLVKNWDQPLGGLRGFIIRFLASGNPVFEHIAIWTLLQLLESGDRVLLESIMHSEDITAAINTVMTKIEQLVNEEERDKKKKRTPAEEENYTKAMDLYGLCQKILQYLKERR